MTSNFDDDLRREKVIAGWMDKYFYSRFNEYEMTTLRPNEYNNKIKEEKAQYQGIDIVLKDKESKVYLIDEKAQTRYLNDYRASFTFEISYLKYGRIKKGWLLDDKKKTTYYMLIYLQSYSIKDFTGLDDIENIDYAKVCLIERNNLLKEIYKLGLTKERIIEEAKQLKIFNGQVEIENIPPEKIVFYKSGKYDEKPINLLVKEKMLDEVSEQMWIVTKYGIKKIKSSDEFKRKINKRDNNSSR